MAQGFSWQLGGRGKVVLGLGLLIALACLGLLLERDGGAPVASVNTASVVPAALVNVSPSLKARVDSSVARVNRLKVTGSKAVATQKVKALAKAEVDQAVKDAKEKLGAKASQFSIVAIVCPILQALRAGFGGFFGAIFDRLIAAFGCNVVPSGVPGGGGDDDDDDDITAAPVTAAPSTNRPQRVRPNRRPAFGRRLLGRPVSSNNR